VIALVIGVAVSLFVALIGTPFFIKLLKRKHFGQFIRKDGPESHYVKRGTPTMGGVMIIVATLSGWIVASFVMFISVGRLPHASSVLVLGLMVSLGALGFLDDYAKVSNQRSLGLSPVAKIVGQGAIGIIFAALSLLFPNSGGLTPASLNIQIFKNFNINLALFGTVFGVVLFIIWVNFLVTAWSNAVNLADGLDGLASGMSLVSFASYTLLCLWMSSQNCALGKNPNHCYVVRDPWDLALVAALIAAACVGFLWWNTSPAQIFMGDTGSLALGGAFAGISILSGTEILAVLIGGVFVLEVLSDIIQIGSYKLRKKRVFKMAPIHHHFEFLGWSEVTIVTRFWILQGALAVIAISLFYGDWVIGFGV
jgi:phospho-N-acetylmuramoyl-pentapeptide-transferase